MPVTRRALHEAAKDVLRAAGEKYVEGTAARAGLQAWAKPHAAPLPKAIDFAQWIADEYRAKRYRGRKGERVLAACDVVDTLVRRCRTAQRLRDDPFIEDCVG